MLRPKTKIFRLLALSILMLASLAFFRIAFAQVDVGMQEIGNNISLTQDDPRTIAARVINIVMLVLGILAVGLIIYAGFVWMTAGGEEDKIDKAKKILRNGVIGLVIILSAWGIATFVLNRLIDASNGNNSSGACTAGQSLSCGCGGAMSCIDGSWGPCLGSDCNSGGGPTSCDGNTMLGGCQAVGQICADDSYCDNDTCSCLPKGELGDSCDGDDTTPTCEADNNLCGEYLSCNPSTCVCEGQPVITRVTPLGGFCEEDSEKACASNSDCIQGCDIATPNGAAGNLLTIMGTNFGAYDPSNSKVLFNNDVAGISPSTVNPACIDSWTNNQIIIAIPSGAATGKLTVVAADNQRDTTNDTVGPIIPDFVANSLERPGLCLLTPEEGRLSDKVNYSGINLYAGGQAYFGDYDRNVRGLDSTFMNPAGLSGTSTVPNLQRGEMSSFVVGTVNGVPQKSNYVNFIKQEEPDAGPYISHFEPTTGRAGQYVTIHGGGFGGARGMSKVFFGNIEADYAFPEVCASSVWKDKQIIVKVPAGLADGNYEIKIELTGKTITSQNCNPNVFTADSDEALKSSICKISPSRGPIGTPVSLWGEYFGDTGSNGLTRFSRDRNVTGEIKSEGGAQKLEPTVPAQAVSGPVRVVKNDQWGNDVNFEIGTCSADAQCSGEVCCPAGTYKQGRCAPALVNCYIEVPRSVFEWGFATGLGEGENPEPYDSCNGMAKALGACQIGAFCPNSPGLCSPFSAAPRNLGPCDSTCATVGACIGQSAGCTFNSALDACVLNNKTCSLNSNYQFNLGDQQYSAVRSCQVYPQFGNQAHWELTTPTSCPPNWVRLDGNRCVDSVSATESTCSVCSDDFICQKNGESTEGICATSQLCSGAAKCEGNTCVSTEGARCDCCCTIGESARDCCAGLTCGGTCGSDATDDGVGLGECTGCTVRNSNGQIDYEQSDLACNCDKFSGKYCDNSTPTGNCVDCSRLSAADCSAHSSSCCLDSKGTETVEDDVCRGGNGQEITSDTNDPNYGYCAYYDCAANPVGSTGECASSTPLKFGQYRNVESCESGCATDPSAFCSTFGDFESCSAAAGCCFDFAEGKCQSGTDETAEGYCAYYNCQAAPNDDQCNIDTKLATGTYSGLQECIDSCPDDDVLPGRDCRNKSTFDFTTCATSFCGSPYECLTSEGGGAVPGGDCGACCCEVGNPASCSGLGNGNTALVCKPDQAPCSGENRGLCCGCSADTDCGDLENVGCDSGTCCRARPAVIAEKMIPAHGTNGICRNTVIKIPFDQDMDPESFGGNVVLLEEHDFGNGVCPAGTFVAVVDGVSAPDVRWMDRVIDRIVRITTKLLRATGLKSGSALAGIPDPSKLYCSVPGTVSSEQGGDGTVAVFTPKKMLAAGTNYFLVVKGDQALDSNSGVRSRWQLGMNGQGYYDFGSSTYIEGATLSFNSLSFGNSYISSFATLSSQGENGGICVIDYIKTDPASYLFQDNADALNENDTDPADVTFDTASDRDKAFTVTAYSADDQPLHPTQNYYWDWDWSVAKPSIASLQTISGLGDNRAFVETASGVTDDSTMLSAKVNMDRFSAPGCNPSSSCVCAEPDCINNCCNLYQEGDSLIGETPLFVFLCKNPWPAVNPATLNWSPWYDTCSGAIGNCANYNYKFYYCRDAGKDGMSDDLPAMINPAVIRGTGSSLICSEGRSTCSEIGATCGPDRNFDGQGDGFCIWDVLKESYFFKESVPTAGSVTGAYDEGDGATVRIEWKSASNLIYSTNPAQMGKFRLYYAPLSSGKMSFVDVKPTDPYTQGGSVCSPAAPGSGEQYTCHFRLGGLTVGENYRFKVSAITAAQVESALSDEKTAMVTDNIAPGIPQGLAGSIQTGQRLRFTWQANPGDTLFYRLYHGVTSGQYGESFDSANGATSMEISSAGYSSGVHYYSLSAVDASGNESGKSTPIVLTITQP